MTRWAVTQAQLLGGEATPFWAGESRFRRSISCGVIVGRLTLPGCGSLGFLGSDGRVVATIMAATSTVIDEHSGWPPQALSPRGRQPERLVVSIMIRRRGVPQRLLSDNRLAFNPTAAGSPAS